MLKNIAKVILIILGVLQIISPIYTALGTGYETAFAFVLALIYGILKSILYFSVFILLNETDEIFEKIILIKERIDRLRDKE